MCTMDGNREQFHQEYFICVKKDIRQSWANYTRAPVVRLVKTIVQYTP